MITQTNLWISFLICLISAGIGLVLAIRRKGLRRDKLKDLAVWVFLGFASFLLALIANAIGIDLGYAEEIAIGVAYSYFLADAPMFNAG